MQQHGGHPLLASFPPPSRPSVCSPSACPFHSLWLHFYRANRIAALHGGQLGRASQQFSAPPRMPRRHTVCHARHGSVCAGEWWRALRLLSGLSLTRSKPAAVSSAARSRRPASALRARRGPARRTAELRVLGAVCKIQCRGDAARRRRGGRTPGTPSPAGQAEAACPPARRRRRLPHRGHHRLAAPPPLCRAQAAEGGAARGRGRPDRLPILCAAWASATQAGARSAGWAGLGRLRWAPGGGGATPAAPRSRQSTACGGVRPSGVRRWGCTGGAGTRRMAEGGGRQADLAERRVGRRRVPRGGRKIRERQVRQGRALATTYRRRSGGVPGSSAASIGSSAGPPSMSGAVARAGAGRERGFLPPWGGRAGVRWEGKILGCPSHQLHHRAQCPINFLQPSLPSPPVPTRVHRTGWRRAGMCDRNWMREWSLWEPVCSRLEDGKTRLSTPAGGLVATIRTLRAGLAT
jgi:hypothetical protein